MSKTTDKTIPLVAIVGRPNVGKSTLFNRLMGRRVAIVDDTPGVTRDRVFGRCRLEGAPCHLVDTGGLTYDMKKGEIEAAVEKQILMSIDDATALVFVVDARAGVLHEDRFVADVLRRSGRPVIVAANKTDNPGHAPGAAEFNELGMGDPVPISALHGRYVDLLIERILSLFPEEIEAEWDDDPIRFCVVGRPNVGKSSITNAILGEERCVVSSIPGTTRDMVDTDFTRDGSPFVIVDTAGVKRRKSHMDSLEFYGFTRANRSIQDSDVSVLVIDAVDGLLEGEKRIASRILELKKGFVMAINKMDLIEKPDYDVFIENFFREAPFMRHYPMIFVSALESSGMDALLDCISDIHQRLNELLPRELLKNVIYDTRALYSPGSRGRKIGEIRGVIHDRVNPPRIIVKTNDPGLFDQRYVRLIENRVRSIFNLSGVPIDLVIAGPQKMKKAKKKEAPADKESGKASKTKKATPRKKSKMKKMSTQKIRRDKRAKKSKKRR